MPSFKHRLNLLLLLFLLAYGPQIWAESDSSASEVTSELTPEVKSETSADVKSEIKPQAIPAAMPADMPELNPDYQRPKIGLVLGGGGAKGSAHIGVIRVLEAMNIPVDYVAGTSMGAYIAGLYALGLSADEMEERLYSVNWNQGYSDRIARNDLQFRGKIYRDKFPINMDIGLSVEGMKLPSGYIQGQSMARLIRTTTHGMPNFRSFDDLPIPLRTVAMDLETMGPYVFDRGNLVTALQASMSVPGALKPIDHDGKLLGDGGIANNLPVDAVKAMGADYVIAVNISDNLRDREKLKSYLNIASQMITHMTGTSTQKQIDLLTDRDVLIAPQVQHIGAGEFDKMPEAMPLGEKAARENQPQLARLSVSERQYQAYLAAKQERRSALPEQESLIPDRIEIINDTKLDDNIIQKSLNLKAGQRYNRETLEENIAELYTHDIYERVDYEIIETDTETVVQVHVKEKSWGPGYLDGLIALESSIGESAGDVSFGVGHRLTDINRFGGEWRNGIVLGARTEMTSDFYSPLDKNQYYYASATIDYLNLERNFYLNNIDPGNDNFLVTDTSDLRSKVEVGAHPNKHSMLGLGYMGSTGSVEAIGVGEKYDYRAVGPYVRYSIDTLDDINFATQGMKLDILVADIDEELTTLDGAETDGEYLQIDWRGAISSGSHSFQTALSYGGYNSDLQIPTTVQDLGGYLKLSGYQRHAISGRYKVFGAALYNYRLSENDFGLFQFPMYVGASLETGNIWNDRDDIKTSDMITSGSVSVGVNSPIGPVVLAYGQSSTGEQSLYFFIGTLFD